MKNKNHQLPHLLDYEEVVLSIVSPAWVNALKQNGRFSSMHEAHSVIQEEFEELWTEIKKKPQDRSKAALREEASQLAAVVIEFIREFTSEN